MLGTSAVAVWQISFSGGLKMGWNESVKGSFACVEGLLGECTLPEVVGQHQFCEAG
jgi:hypothetical protein